MGLRIITNLNANQAFNRVSGRLRQLANIVVEDIVLNLENGVNADGAPLHRPRRLQSKGAGLSGEDELEILKGGRGRKFAVGNVGGPGIDTTAMLNLLKVGKRRFIFASRDRAFIKPSAGKGFSTNALNEMDAADYIDIYNKLYASGRMIAFSSRAIKSIDQFLRVSLT